MALGSRIEGIKGVRNDTDAILKLQCQGPADGPQFPPSGTRGDAGGGSGQTSLRLETLTYCQVGPAYDPTVLRTRAAASPGFLVFTRVSILSVSLCISELRNSSPPLGTIYFSLRTTNSTVPSPFPSCGVFLSDATPLATINRHLQNPTRSPAKGHVHPLEPAS